MARQPQVLDYHSVTVADTAGSIFGLATSGFLSEAPTGARSFVATCETAAVRARGDGTDATGSEGQYIAVGDTIYMGESEFGSMTFIRDTSTTGYLRGHFYNVEVDVIMGKFG